MNTSTAFEDVSAEDPRNPFRYIVSNRMESCLLTSRRWLVSYVQGVQKASLSRLSSPLF